MGDSTQPSVRRCDIEDTGLIADLGRRTFFDAYADTTPVDQMERHLAAAFAAEQIRGELANPGSTFFLAEASGVAAGFVKINVGPAQTEPENESGLEIESLYVLAEFQGWGIGRALFEMVIQQAERASSEYLWLGVWEMNTQGMSFWRRLGFVEHGSHPFEFGGTTHTDLVMRRALR